MRGRVERDGGEQPRLQHAGLAGAGGGPGSGEAAAVSSVLGVSMIHFQREAVAAVAPDNGDTISAPADIKNETTMGLHNGGEQSVAAENINNVPRDTNKQTQQIQQSQQTQQTAESAAPESPECPLEAAPQPGSLADREHRKWAEAGVELRHNPYTRESIARRLVSRSSSFLDSPHILDAAPAPPPQPAPREPGPRPQPRQIYCGLRSVAAARYNRDYFVTERGEARPPGTPAISFTPEQEQAAVSGV